MTGYDQMGYGASEKNGMLNENKYSIPRYEKIAAIGRGLVLI